MPGRAIVTTVVFIPLLGALLALVASLDGGAEDGRPGMAVGSETPSSVPGLIEEVFLVGSVDGGPPERKGVFFVAEGQSLVLWPIAKADGLYVGPLESFWQDGEAVTVDVGTVDGGWSWFLAQPDLSGYDNAAFLSTNGLPRVAQPITYSIDDAPVGSTPWFSPTEVLPAGQPGWGTYTVGAWPLDWAPVGIGALDGAAAPGPATDLAPGMVQVVIRKDDTPLGLMTELFGVPFVHAPALLPDGRHQTDARVGADCAALAVYGAKRSDLSLSYRGPAYLAQILEPIGDGPYAPAGSPLLYRNAEGTPAPLGPGALQPGDVVHHGVQVAVLWEDRGVQGVLDPEDLVLQTFGAGPHIVPLSASPFASEPVQLFHLL